MSYTVTTTYDRLGKLVKKIIKDSGNTPALCFSMFESVDDKFMDDWIIKIPDLESNKPVFKGKCQFFSDYPEDCYTSRVIKNPTWNDIIIEANMAVLAEGSGHVFLENVRFKKENKQTGAQVYELIFGS